MKKNILFYLFFILLFLNKNNIHSMILNSKKEINDYVETKREVIGELHRSIYSDIDSIIEYVLEYEKFGKLDKDENFILNKYVRAILYLIKKDEKKINEGISSFAIIKLAIKKAKKYSLNESDIKALKKYQELIV
ncbi:hypothetical protein GF385_01605, partial [Candidatus Dependentiae bacterium]|nr:hypothetical protein [Candidatus Dependentiae bacterium]